jgi:sn-glycerol 3-phosphate transport system substrate-binding protein
MRTPRAAVAFGVVLALALSACGSSSKSAQTSSGNRADPGECGLTAFAHAKKPVEVTFWHEMSRLNADWLVQHTDAFNKSQHDVHVTLVQFPNYQDLLTKYLAGLSTGDLPDLFQPEDTTVQRLIDSKSTVPMQACVDADHYSLSDFLPRATAFYSFKGVLQGMPWSISNIVLWYNRTAFQKAGLDPDKPPQTLDEVTADSRRIVQSGAAKYGISLRVEPYMFEFINAKSNGTYVNHGNGRDSRTTAATLTAPVAQQIWTWWKQMVDQKLALNTGGATGNIDHMLAIGTGDAAMTFEASAVIGTVRQVLETGQYGTVKIGIGPLPALQPEGGVPVGDGSLWIAKHASPEKRAAAWQFVKYLSSPEQQASLAAELGFAPIRTTATEQPELQKVWAADPIFKVSYDQLVSGPTNVATVGPLIGDYQGVRDAVRNGMLAMLTGGLSPKAALEKAQRDADGAITTYNSRIGAG